jgi:hypothetical protein
MDPRPPILVYQALMESIKGRISCLRRLASGELTLGDERTNWELAALQLRTILESIAFASMAAHRDAYASVHAKFAQHWKAAKILHELAAIHPNFYPQPMRIGQPGDGGVRKLSGVEDYLTQQEFVELYDICSQMIHAHNPFGDLAPIDARLSLADWVGRIQALLDTHMTRMYGSQQRWVVQMAGGPGGRVQVAVAEPARRPNSGLQPTAPRTTP